MTIRIGKASDNDFIINDPHVSRYHARLTADKDGAWLLEDLESTNGTFVNGDQVVKRLVSPSDTIRLGDAYTLDLTEVLQHNNDYSEAFARLQPVYDTYVSQKIKIQSSNVFKTRIYQSIPFAIIGLIGVVISIWGKGSTPVLVVSLLVAVCAPVAGIYLGARQSAKTPRQLQELADRFKTDYVCPKCGTFLGEVPWQSLQNRKQCPISSCKARWVNDMPFRT